MKKWIKGVLALICILAGVVVFANWEASISAVEHIYSSGTVWVIIAFLLVLIPVVLLVPWAVLRFKLRMARGLGEKLIPQEERHGICEGVIEAKWRSLTVGKSLTLVSNYIVPDRKGAEIIEQVTYTTNKAFAQKRIKEGNLEKDEVFKVWINCRTGEWFTQEDIEGPDETRDFTDRHWLRSIERKEDTVIDRYMKKAMAEAVGEEVVKKEISKEKPEQKKEEVKT